MPGSRSWVRGAGETPRGNMSQLAHSLQAPLGSDRYQYPGRSARAGSPMMSHPRDARIGAGPPMNSSRSIQFGANQCRSPRAVRSPSPQHPRAAVPDDDGPPCLVFMPGLQRKPPPKRMLSTGHPNQAFNSGQVRRFQSVPDMALGSLQELSSVQMPPLL